MVDPIVIHITKRLRQIARELDKHSKHIQETYQVTVPQLMCLREIHAYGPISLGALRKIVFLNSSTVTGIVDRLEKRNFVRRTRVSKDRRKIHVEITDEGTRFIEEAPTPLQQQFIERLHAIDEEELQWILWAIEKLVVLLSSEEDTVDTGENADYANKSGQLEEVPGE